jgi:DNA-binding transcriptional regulator/RsmH inhibitor MraZ
VVLIGVRDHLELWDAARWQEYLNSNAARFDAVAEGAFRK